MRESWLRCNESRKESRRESTTLFSLLKTQSFHHSNSKELLAKQKTTWWCKKFALSSKSHSSYVFLDLFFLDYRSSAQDDQLIIGIIKQSNFSDNSSSSIWWWNNLSSVFISQTSFPTSSTLFKSATENKNETTRIIYRGIFILRFCLFLWKSCWNVICKWYSFSLLLFFGFKHKKYIPRNIQKLSCPDCPSSDSRTGRRKEHHRESIMPSSCSRDQNFLLEQVIRNFNKRRKCVIFFSFWS